MQRITKDINALLNTMSILTLISDDNKDIADAMDLIKSAGNIWGRDIYTSLRNEKTLIFSSHAAESIKKAIQLLQPYSQDKIIARNKIIEILKTSHETCLYYTQNKQSIINKARDNKVESERLLSSFLDTVE